MNERSFSFLFTWNERKKERTFPFLFLSFFSIRMEVEGDVRKGNHLPIRILSSNREWKKKKGKIHPQKRSQTKKNRKGRVTEGILSNTRHPVHACDLRWDAFYETWQGCEMVSLDPMVVLDALAWMFLRKGTFIIPWKRCVFMYFGPDERRARTAS